MHYKITPEADNDLIGIYVHGYKIFGERQAEKFDVLFLKS